MRSYLTLKSFCSKAEFANCQIPIMSKEGICIDAENWHKSEEGRALVWGEYLRIKTYGSRGDFFIDEIIEKLESVEECLS